MESKIHKNKRKNYDIMKDKKVLIIWVIGNRNCGK